MELTEEQLAGIATGLPALLPSRTALAEIPAIAGPSPAGPRALFGVNPFGLFLSIRDCSTAADLVVDGGLAATYHELGIPGYD